MASIFIVEDERDICETYADILEAAGHRVDFSLTVATAFKRVMKHFPDVIILDMQLPGESGMLLAAFARRMKPLAHTKIVIISGHPELAKKAIELYGAHLFLQKPVSPDLLRTTIHQLTTH